jgi:hypothetical protein
VGEEEEEEDDDDDEEEEDNDGDDSRDSRGNKPRRGRNRVNPGAFSEEMMKDFINWVTIWKVGS